MEKLIEELKELLTLCKKHNFWLFVGEPTSNMVNRGFEIHPVDFSSETRLQKKIEKLKSEMIEEGIELNKNKYFEDVQNHWKNLK